MTSPKPSPDILKLGDQVYQLQQQVERLRARESGPSLGEFYAMWQGLPGLRGLWYPGSFGDNPAAGAMPDQSGQGRTLSYNGNPTLNLYNNTVPYWDYDGTGDYHSRADEPGLDISGTETQLASALRGLTLGGWFWIDATVTRFGLMAKNTGAGQIAYDLWIFETGTVGAFRISVDGTNVKDVVSGSVSAGAWHFIVGRFVPSTSVDIYLDGVKSTDTGTISASIFNSNSALEIGRFAGGSALNGRCALAFIAAAAWPDELIEYLLVRSRLFFGL